MQAKPKRRKCRQCKSLFTPRNSFHKLCVTRCAIEYVKASSEENKRGDIQKALDSEHRAAKAKLNDKDRSWWLKKTQIDFNRMIRLRDKDLPCISCGTTNPNIQYAAGHFRTVGAAGELRFNYLNCHKQCNANCNQARSGNIGEYRIGLVKKIGLEAVEALEGPHEPMKYTIDDLKQLRVEIKAKIKELEQ